MSNPTTDVKAGVPGVVETFERQIATRLTSAIEDLERAYADALARLRTLAETAQQIDGSSVGALVQEAAAVLVHEVDTRKFCDGPLNAVRCGLSGGVTLHNVELRIGNAGHTVYVGAPKETRLPLGRVRFFFITVPLADLPGTKAE